MKFNWGTGIAMLYLGFVIGMLTLVTMSMRQKIDLVADNYYEQELGFQKKLDKMNRANTLAEPLRWEVTEQGVLVRFPQGIGKEKVGGTINLYCPADNRKDTRFEVLPGADGVQLIPANKLQAGRYQLQIDWQAGEATYWNEGTIVINE
ncbi:FixH family protein [Telluribacter sp. SYSU D00476]|uniref:FixH family protein n=1 Tax=Telluribacter sp. SYSU D00476 TaxID=2811430 RepID=UPI001FF6C130|nr:FixH family protein [Telluribacter sp. SYSU D00476]